MEDKKLILTLLMVSSQCCHLVASQILKSEKKSFLLNASQVQ